ncbi:MAG: thioredoxin [bacterium]|jgi:thioredoxin 1
MSDKVHTVTDANFDAEVLKSETPVFVDFWANWCPPCKIVGPIVDEIAHELDGKLKVCKVNVDDSQQTAQAYGIRAIPTLMLFKNGSAVKTLVGAHPKEELKKEIESEL